MLIIGAKGFAKEILEILKDKEGIKQLALFDNVNPDIGSTLYNEFPILNSEPDVIEYFQKFGPEFTVGIGNPALRNKMVNKFYKLGGKLKSVHSNKASISSYGVEIGEGVVILNGVHISPSVKIGKGSMIYYNCNITHDTYIGEFVEVSPAVTILGQAIINSFTHLGANSTILPNVEIGHNVIIGAGAVVTKNIPDNSVAVGTPAKVIRSLAPLKNYLNQ